MMKNANLLPKLQETLSNLNNLQTTPEKCVQDLTSVLIAVSEWIYIEDIPVLFQRQKLDSS